VRNEIPSARCPLRHPARLQITNIVQVALSFNEMPYPNNLEVRTIFWMVVLATNELPLSIRVMNNNFYRPLISEYVTTHE